MVVVIRNEKHREMPVLFTGRNIIQIQQTSAVFILGEEEGFFVRAF